MLKALIRLASIFPVEVKGSYYERLFRRVLFLYKRTGGVAFDVKTNMGISNKLVVKFPATLVPATYLFGSPRTYVGEYYSLVVSSVLVGQSKYVVDIGSNWGYYTFYLRMHSKVPIFYFEPNRDLFRYMSENINLNQLNNVFGYCQAVSDRQGEEEFYLDNTSDLNSSLIKNEGNNSEPIKVDCTSFDSWSISVPYALSEIFVKVDVENAEWKFVKGAELRFPIIKYLLIELLGPARRSGIVDYIKRTWRLNAYYINGDKLEYVETDDYRYTANEYNWLFCKESPGDLTELFKSTVIKVVR